MTTLDPKLEMTNLISTLLKARDTAHVLHWKTKSFSMHLALEELYEDLLDLTDEIFEMFMGKYGDDEKVQVGGDNPFDDSSALTFISQLDSYLAQMKDRVPQDGWLINKYEEIQGNVHRIKYKLENLH
jgi:hypothetical protein